MNRSFQVKRFGSNPLGPHNAPRPAPTPGSRADSLSMRYSVALLCSCSTRAWRGDVGQNVAVSRHFSKRERRDSNPRPPA
jgi:hypothetical protein